MGTFSIWHWLVVLIIVLLIFGSKKVKSWGSDIGEAIRNFKNAINEEETQTKQDGIKQDK